MKISIVIIVKNGAKTLGKCLDSLHAFDDIVIYNNGSSDETASIASKYTHVHLIEGKFIGFGPTRNIAATYAKHNWILSLDSDEVMNEQIIQEISNLVYNPKTVYSLLRKNFYQTTEIRHCWGADEVVRIYHREITQYSCDYVHEYVLSDGLNIVKLQNSFSHFPYQNIVDFMRKANYYSTLFASNHVGKKSSSPSKALLNSLYSFFRTYILKRGFLDGHAGLIIAFSHMTTNFYKYMKLYEMNLEHNNNFRS